PMLVSGGLSVVTTVLKPVSSPAFAPPDHSGAASMPTGYACTRGLKIENHVVPCTWLSRRLMSTTSILLTRRWLPLSLYAVTYAATLTISTTSGNVTQVSSSRLTTFLRNR